MELLYKTNLPMDKIPVKVCDKISSVTPKSTVFSNSVRTENARPLL